MRATPRKIFLTADRTPEVHFYTSNVPKFLQGRDLFSRAGLRLRHFVSVTEPYSERYELGQGELLRRAVREVSDKIRSDSMFFVEDTSMRLEALSGVEGDVPGLRVKEWFQQTDFAGLDRILRALQNDRRATIKSDVALHVPGLDEPIFFHGETLGVVADAPSENREPSRYPWLAPDTFSGWFIPDGAKARLADMDLEQSLDFDFRAKAIGKVIDRLEEFTAILNVPSALFRRRQTSSVALQQSLFEDQISQPPIIVIGGTCAGKTTFAERASLEFQRRHVEASSIVRMLTGAGAISGQAALESAKYFLENSGPDIVARQILKLYEGDLRSGMVLTGFRAIEELLYFCTETPDAIVIFVAASERTRFERHLARGRYTEAASIESFRQLDQGQFSLGLLRVARDLADLSIENEDTIPEYYAKVDVIMAGAPQPGMKEVRRLPDFKTRRQKSQLYRCLRVLVGELSLTSREISARTAEKGQRRIATRNVNEVLKQYPELANRQTALDEEIRYQILPAGIAYVRFMDLRDRSPVAAAP